MKHSFSTAKMPVTPSPVALSIGRDALLLGTRNLVLDAAGFSVVSAVSSEQAVRELETRRFDLVILCHSTTEEDRVEITSASRKKDPSTPIVLVSDRSRAADGHFDAVVDSDPSRMLKTVRELVGPRLDMPDTSARNQSAG